MKTFKQVLTYNKSLILPINDTTAINIYYDENNKCYKIHYFDHSDKTSLSHFKILGAYISKNRAKEILMEILTFEGNYYIMPEE